MILRWPLCLALLSYTKALYSSKGPVKVLTASDFDAALSRSQKTHLIEFYAPWCGHCKSLAPTFERTAQHLKGLVEVNAVDCDEDSNRSICAKYDIEGFPTLKIFPGPSTRDGKRGRVQDYNGARTAQGLSEAAKDAMPNFVKKLKDGQAGELESGDTPKVVLFTNKGSTSPLYKGLASEFTDLDFYQVRDTEESLMTQFGVGQAPKVFYLDKGTRRLYDGPIDFEHLSAWLRTIGPSEGEAEEVQSHLIHIKDEKSPLSESCPNLKTSHSSPCIITFLPPLEEEYPESVSNYNEAIEMASGLEMASDRSSKSLWIALDHSLSSTEKLKEVLGLSDDTPNLVVINSKSYHPFRGAWTKDEIAKFLRMAIRGGPSRAKVFDDELRNRLSGPSHSTVRDEL